MRGAMAPEPAFGSIESELELVGPAGAPVLLESELVCALAGKASIVAKRGTITKLPKCLGEASKHMSCPWLRRNQPVNVV